MSVAEPTSIAAPGDGLAEDVLDGLTRPFKELPPRHLYDERSSELFDQICELPEYCPTRSDRHGMPVARLDYTQCDNDRATIAFAKRILEQIHEAAGAEELLTIMAMSARLADRMGTRRSSSPAVEAAA